MSSQSPWLLEPLCETLQEFLVTAVWGNREEVRQISKGGSVSPEAELLVFWSRSDALARCITDASQREEERYLLAPWQA